MKDKPKRSHHRKVVPLVKAVAKAVVEPVPVTTVSRWARVYLWTVLLPSRVRHAVAEVFAQSKDSHEES